MKVESKTKSVSLSPSHRPAAFLYSTGHRDSAKCSKCGVEPGDLVHLLWRCPKLLRYWDDVFTKINEVYSILYSLVTPNLHFWLH